jgi:hypothetical protein
VFSHEPDSCNVMARRTHLIITQQNHRSLVVTCKMAF